MNYWPAEVANLAPCHAPLFDWMKTLAAPGTRTAQIHYGANGWVVHHVSNPYGHTTPSDGLCGVWPLGAAWLCWHLWEHYRFGGDRTFLEETAYPLLKGAARFLLDFLVEEPQTGRLVTCPSHSPENRFVAADGSHAWFTWGATMDLEIIHDLFTHTVRAAEILGTDQEFAAELTTL
jgi:alpha-L-fucosidase 2